MQNIFIKINKINDIKKTILFALHFTIIFSTVIGPLVARGAETTFTTSLTTTGLTMLPPSVPTNLTATAVSHNQIDLSWTASVPNYYAIAGYRIFRDEIFIATTTSTSYSDTGLTPLTGYSYKVEAFDTLVQLSGQSGIAYATTTSAPTPTPTPTPTPSTPGGGGGGGGGTNTIEITNINIIPGTNQAEIRFDTSVAAQTKLQWGFTTDFEIGSQLNAFYGVSHSQVITGLSEGLTYKLRINASSANGVSTYRDVSFTTILPISEVGPLPNPTDFVAIAKTKTIDLSWTNPTDPRFNDVRIVRTEGFYPIDQYDGIPLYEGDSESFIDTTAKPGVTYYYAIFSRDRDLNYSSGALAQARIALEGEISTTTVIDPFANLPEATNVDPMFKALRLSDFEFLQDGRILATVGETVAIHGDKNLTIRLAYNKVPKILKTIAFTLKDPTDKNKVFPFLLRANADKTYYEATIGALGRSGRYGMSVAILDYENNGLVRLNGTLAALAFTPWIDFTNNFDIFGLLILFLIILIAILAIVMIRKWARNHPDFIQGHKDSSNTFGRGTAKKVLASIVLLVAFNFAIFGIDNANAGINQQINYQGKLTTSLNAVVPDGSYNIRFKLYTTRTGGSPIWTETWCNTSDCAGTGVGSDNRIAITNGLFSTMLGSTTALTGVDFNQTLYLGVEIGGSGAVASWDGEMSPRKILGAVPSAFVAEVANTLSGLNSSQFLRSDAQNATSSASTFINVVQTGAGKIAEFFGSASQSVLSLLSNGNVGIGTTTPYAKLSVAGEIVGQNFTATSTSATSTLAGGLSVAGSAGLNVLQNGKVGIGTVAPIGSLHLVGTAATSNWLGLFAENGITPEDSAVINPVQNRALSVQGNGAAYFMGRDVTNNIEFIMGSSNQGAAFAGSMTAHDFQLRTENIIRMTIKTSSGNVGIGTSSPYQKLSVDGNVVANTFISSSTNSASVFPYASTTALTVSGTNGLQLASGLNGPLQANNGLVSATTSIGVLYGGTGWSNIQSNSILLGNGTGKISTTSQGVDGYVLSLASGVPTWVSTSSINNGVASLSIVNGTPLTGAITFATSSQTTNGLTVGLDIINSSQTYLFAPSLSGTLSVAGGGTGASTFGQGWIYTDGGTGAFNSSTSPTVNYITATSTTATSTFAGGLSVVGSTGFNVLQNGKVGIGTANPLGTLDISSGGIAIYMGADGSANTRTNNTQKVGRIIAAQYSNAGVGSTAIITNNSSSGNDLYIGGGSASYNSATGINFYTGINASTVQGSIRMAINNVGNIGIASTTPWALLGVNPNGISGPSFAIGSSTKTDFIVTNAGNVGIGTSSPTTSLYVFENDSSNPNIPAATIQRNYAGSMASRMVTLLLRNTGEDTSGPDNYQNEVHLRLQTGTTNTYRRYIDFTGPDGVDDMVTGVNADNVYILHDGNAVAHRFWIEGTAGPYNSGDMRFSALGTGAVTINRPTIPGEATENGTGGLKVYSGGTTLTTELNHTLNPSGYTFEKGGSTKYTMNQTGQVGIGIAPTNTTARQLELASSSLTTTTSGDGLIALRNTDATLGSVASILFISNEGTLSRRSQISGGLDGTSGSKGFIAFSTMDAAGNFQERAKLNGLGYFGIGTTSPYAKLSVVGQTVAEYFTATSTSIASTFPYASTTALTVSGSLYNTSLADGCLNITFGLIGSTGTSCIVGGVSGESVFSRNSTTNLIYHPTTTDSIAFGVTASSSPATLYIDNSNRLVGIGTSTPNKLLSVVGSNNLADQTISLGAYSSNVLRSWDIIRKAYNPSKNKYDLEIANNNYDGDLLLLASTTYSGRVGIGTTSPYAKLSVVGQTVSAYFTATTTTASTFPYASTTVLSASTICITSDCRTSWPTASGAEYDWKQENNVFGVNSLTPTTTIPLQIKSTATSTFLGGIESWSKIGAPYFYATSTTATSTFAGGLVAGSSSGLAVLQNGSVGIGTLSPYYKLDVGGTVGAVEYYGQVGYDLNFVSQGNSNFILDADNNDTSQAFTFKNHWTTELMRLTEGGNLGLGTTSPYAKLSIQANNGETNTSLFTIASSTASATTTLFTVLNNGNVGIGTSTPNKNLSIVGSSNLADQTISLGAYSSNVLRSWDIIRKAYNPSKDKYDLEIANNSYNGDLLLLASTTYSGRVGIGTTSPYAKLSVVGETVSNYFTATSTTATSTFPNILATNLRLTGSLYDSTNSAGTNGYVLQSNGTTAQWVSTSSLNIAGGAGLSGGTAGMLASWTSGSTLTATGTPTAASYFASSTTATSTFLGGFIAGTNGLNVLQNGLVGIGTTSPSTHLAVAGNIYSTGKLRAGGASISSESTTVFNGTQIASGLSDPTGAGSSVAYGQADGYWTGSESHSIRVYAYRLVDGVTKVFSSGYSQSATTSPSGAQPYVITWTWNAVAGADGYRVMMQGPVYNGCTGYNTCYFDVSGTTFVDDSYSVIYANGYVPTSYNGALTLIGDQSISGSINFASNSNYLKLDGTPFLNISTSTQSMGLGLNANENKLGANNIAIGNSALFSNVLGNANIALGNYALTQNTVGGQNIAIGNSAMANNISGLENTAIGNYALINNTTGRYNVALGSSAMILNTTGQYNTAVGSYSGYANVSGQNNTTIGYKSAQNAKGSINTVIGSNAMYNNETGTSSVVIGYYAGYGVASNSFSSSTIIGTYAGKSVTTGSNNIIIGSEAGDAITSGSNNIVIGTNIDAPSNTASNQLNIANIIYGINNSGTGSTLSTGTIGIGTTSPFAKLSIHANNGQTTTSLFAIGSSTANSTTTLFTVTNDGKVGIGTASLDSLLTLYANAQSSTRESFLKARLSEGGNNIFELVNSTITNGVYVPALSGYVDSSNALHSLEMRGLVSAANDASDSSTSGVLTFTAMRTDSSTNPNQGTFTNIQNRRLFTFNNQSGPLLTIAASGNVGIGTSSPQAPFHIYSSGATNTTLPGFIITRSDTSNQTHLQHYFAGINYLSQNLVRDVGGTWSMDNSSNPGTAIVQDTRAGQGYVAIFGNDAIAGTFVPTERFRVGVNGNVGVGSSTPWAQLSINPNGISGSAFAVGSSTKTDFVVTNSGNVGIGTTSPFAKFSVTGIASIDNYVRASYFIATSSTASTFPYASTTALTVSGTNGLTLDNLNGPLQAVNGAVSATSTLSVSYGGTGLSTIPTYGKLLVGNSSGGYDLAATSTLGILASSAIGIGSQGFIPYYAASEQALTATSSLFLSQSSFVGIGTTTPTSVLSVFSASAPQFQLAYNKDNYLTTGVSSSGGVTLVVNGTAGGLTITNPQPTAVVSGTGTAAPNSLQVNGATGGNSLDTNIGVGGIGGGIQFTAGIGGTALLATFSETGGAGGAIAVTGGIGGAAGSPSVDFMTRVAGQGGQLTFASGAGGDATNGGTGSSNTAGAGGKFVLKGGVGGNASGATVNNGGNGGSLYISGGAGGTGSSANGSSGDVFLGYDSLSSIGNVYFGNQNVSYVGSTGNFGIGTTSPYAKLSVVGETVSNYFTATSTTATSTFPNILATNLRLIGSLYDSTNSAGTNGYVLQSNGTTAQWVSTSSLNITGATSLTGGTTGMLASWSGGSTLTATGTPTADAYVATSTTATSTLAGGLTVAGSSGLTVMQNGNVGIGSTTPYSKLSIVSTSAGLTNLFSIATSSRFSTLYGLSGASTTPNEYVKIASGGNTIFTGKVINPTIVGGKKDDSLLAGAQSVYVSGDYAYVVNSTDTSLRIINVASTTNPYIVGGIKNASLFNGANHVFVAGDYAYVTSRTDDSMRIVDVSNPASPAIVGGIKDATLLDGARDTYVSGKYAYTVSYTDASLRIIDISNPTSPRFVGALKDASNLAGVQAVFVSGKYAYTGNVLDNSVRIIDISNPTNPYIVGGVKDLAKLDGITSIYVSGNYLYATDNNERGLRVIDISNPASPTIVGNLIDQTYFNNAQSVFVSGKYAYVASTDGDYFLVIDISNPNQPLMVSAITNSSLNGAGSVFVSGQYAYVANSADNSLRIIDVGGAEVSNLFAGSLKADTLLVTGLTQFNQGLYVRGGISGDNLNIHGIGSFTLATSTSYSATFGNPIYALTANVLDTNTSGISSVASLMHSGLASTSVGVNGIGTALSFGAIDANGSATTTGLITSIFTNTSATTPTSDMLFSVKNNAGSMSEAMRINNNGFVGIGTTSPYSFLSISNSASTAVNTPLFTIASTTAGNSTTTLMTVLANGYVGIGTNNPQYALDVGAGVFTTTRLGTILFSPPGHTSSAEYISGNTNVSIGSRGNISLYIDSNNNTSDSFILYGNNSSTELFRITDTGNMGLGTSSPYSKFAITNNSVSQTAFSLYGFNSQTSPLFLVASTTGSATSTALIIDSNGKVGIGTSSPYAQLSVQGLIAGQYLSADSTTSTSTLAGGLNVGQGNLVYDFTTGITSVNALETGNLNFDTDAGAVSWADLPISSAPLNAVQSYTAQIAGTGVLTVYGLSNGSGGVATTSVAIGTSTPYTAGLTVWGRDILSTTRVVDVVNNASTSLLTIYNGGAVSIGGSTSTTTINGYLDVLGTGANATSTFSSNLWVKGTLRSNLSYVGDLIFANDFTFTESLPINSSTTQALYLNNQRGDRLLAIDENGNLNITGDVCAKNFTCFNASLDKLNTDIGNLASSTDSLTKKTSSVQTLADAIVALDLKVDAFIASSTVDIGSIIASSTALLASNTDFQNAIASSSANILVSNDTFIQMVSNTVKNIVASAQDWVVEKFTAKVAYLNRVEAETVAISKGMEIVDQSTGSVWCVTIKNGDWNKVQGTCSAVASTTPVVPEITPSPSISPTPTPVVTPVISTPATTTSPEDNATSTANTTAPTVSGGGNGGEVSPSPSPLPVISIAPETSPEPVQSTATTPESSPASTPAPVESTPSSAPTTTESSAPVESPVIESAPAETTPSSQPSGDVNQ